MAGKSKLRNWSSKIVLFIPRCGSFLKLEDDWSFRLFKEYRNDGLFDVFCSGRPRNIVGTDIDVDKLGREFVNVTFPVGTVLSVSRVYVRQESKTSHGMNKDGEYNSITFTLKELPGKEILVEGHRVVLPKASGRFWAKLADVNRMECVVDLGEAVSPIDRVADVEGSGLEKKTRRASVEQTLAITAMSDDDDELF